MARLAGLILAGMVLAVSSSTPAEASCLGHYETWPADPGRNTDLLPSVIMPQGDDCQLDGFPDPASPAPPCSGPSCSKGSNDPAGPSNARSASQIERWVVALRLPSLPTVDAAPFTDSDPSIRPINEIRSLFRPPRMTFGA
jgi:hypothetical protein